MLQNPPDVWEACTQETQRHDLEECYQNMKLTQELPSELNPIVVSGKCCAWNNSSNTYSVLIKLWSLTVLCCSATNFLRLRRKGRVPPTSPPPVSVVVCFKVPLLSDKWSQDPDHTWLLEVHHQQRSNCNKGSYFLFLCGAVLANCNPYTPIVLQRPRGNRRWMYKYINCLEQPYLNHHN